jgi:hypothetical protein
LPSRHRRAWGRPSLFGCRSKVTRRPPVEPFRSQKIATSLLPKAGSWALASLSRNRT